MPKPRTPGHQEFASLYRSGLTVRDIVDRFGCTQKTVDGYLNAAGVERRGVDSRFRKHELNERYFEKINTEDKAYWLGFVLADGNVHGNRLTIGLAEVDVQHLRKFLLAVGSSSSVIFSRSSGYTDRMQTRVRVNSRHMMSDLLALGVTPRKSATACAPLDRIPEPLHKHFWRGVVDGDGHVSKPTPESQSPTVNLVGPRVLCEQFKAWVQTLGPTQNKVCRKRDCKDLWVVSFSRRELSHRILQELYEGCSVALDRKEELADRWGFVPAPYKKKGYVPRKGAQP